MGTYDTPLIWPVAKLYMDKRNPETPYASVRDYIVFDCIKMKKDLLIKYNDSYMLVSYPELDRYMNGGKVQFHKMVFKEKAYPHRDYELIDFRWGGWKMITPPTNPIKKVRQND